ncbi:MAG: glycosyltransferase, partial [Armatimonadetes bacterium]|nr:glycosyltransferase [Armatimonadota bacterium]
VRVIEPGRNLGFAAGNNLGIEATEGDYTLLLNPDTVVRPGALAELLRVADERPEVAAWQPLLLYPDGRVQWSWGYRPGLWSELWLVLVWRKWVETAWWQARARAMRGSREVSGICLAALFVPRWVWERIGLLATEPFMYFEDADLSERLHQQGLSMRLVPETVVEHWQGQSSGQVPHVKRRAHYISRMWFYDTHRSRFAAWLVRRLSVLRAWHGVRKGGSAAEELWGPVLDAARRRGE